MILWWSKIRYWSNISNVKISILQSNKGFCLSVCLFVCLSLNNSGTAGPIWLNYFLLAPYCSRDGFRQKRFWIRGPVFPKIRKNQFPAKIFIKYLSKNVQIFMWKIAEMIALSDFKNPVTYYLLRRKGRATSKNVEGAQPPPPDSGFSR